MMPCWPRPQALPFPGRKASTASAPCTKIHCRALHLLVGVEDLLGSAKSGKTQMAEALLFAKGR